MTDLRPLTIALDTVDAKDCKKGDLVMNENHKLLKVMSTNNHKGFTYIGLEDGNSWFLKDSDQIRRVRR